MKYEEDVVKGYSTREAKREYDKIGLWPEEKKLIQKYFNKGSKVLDIGCGAGRTTIPLAEQGYEVHGVDITPELVKIAEKNAREYNVNPELKIMNVLDLNYPSESFDNAIFSYNGIEEIPPSDIQEAINNIHHVLKQDGYFIFTTHTLPGRRFKHWMRWVKKFFTFHFNNLFNIEQKEECFGDIYLYHYGKHIYAHFAPPRYYIQRLRKAGFEKITLTPKKKVMKEEQNGFSFLNNFTSDYIFFICRK